MKIVEVNGNGACLFTSLRLGFELLTVVKQLKITNVADDRFRRTFYAKGPFIDSAAEALRLLICKWYNPVYFDKEVPFVDGKSTRRKILETELCTTDTIILEKYVEAMKHNRQWGSFPEIIAFAMMIQAEVVVYQPINPELVQEKDMLQSINKKYLYVKTVQQVRHPESIGCIHLLFTGNHYDLLIDDDDYASLDSHYAFLKDRVSATEVQKV